MGVVYVGADVAPKTFVEKKVNADGAVIDKQFSVSGKPMELKIFLQKELQHQPKLGLQQIKGEGSHTVYFKVWHDHGDLCGHSHFLSTVMVMYDENIHTSESQRLVEKPVVNF